MPRQIYLNGALVTLEKGEMPEAMLVEDGRIRALGTQADLTAQAANAEIIDLDGAALLPGFIDPHSHFSQVAGEMLQIRIEPDDTLERLKDKTAAHIRENGLSAESWVQISGLDPRTLELDRTALDALHFPNPMLATHRSGHSGFLNAKGLESLGISSGTPAPEGGRIDFARGLLEENALFFYQKKIPLPGTQALLGAYARAQEKYASHGITTLQEGLMVEQMLPMVQALVQSDLLRIDLLGYPDPASWPKFKACFGADGDHAHFRLGGIKVFLDGSPQGRTAWMRAPYPNSSDCGYGTLSDDALRSAMELAAREGVQLLAHANGDRAVEQFLNCLEESEKRFPKLRTLRPTIIHGQLIGLDQLARAKALGAYLSLFVAHVYHWGDTHIENFGRSRAEHISPAASALRAGVPLSFHQDSPVIEMNMLETLWCAVARRTRNGVTLGKSEAISALDALKAVTLGAAAQYGEADQKGSLRPGKRADFAVLDQNPLEVSTDELPKLRVLKTIKNGEVIFEA